MSGALAAELLVEQLAFHVRELVDALVQFLGQHGRTSFPTNLPQWRCDGLAMDSRWCCDGLTIESRCSRMALL
jgi:hypothetical protein